VSPAQETLLRKVKHEKQHFITGYFVGGDPNITSSVQLIKEAVASGLDVVELGIPSKNPFLEGEVIKRAHERSIQHFCEYDDYLSFLQVLRREISVPIWIMGYAEDIIHTKLYKKLVDEKYMDGLIIPNLSLMEGNALKRELANTGVQVIPVVNNEMNDSYLSEVLENCNFVYCQIYQGKTGSEIKDFTTLPLFQEKIRKLTNAALMAGFGIKTPIIAKQVLQAGFDGVVVGSEIVRIIEENSKVLSSFIESLVAAKFWGDS
jgi:tryptophan synthase alpha chain